MSHSIKNNNVETFLTPLSVAGLDHLPPLPFIHLMEMYEQGGVYVRKAGGFVINILKCVCGAYLSISTSPEIFLPVEHGMVPVLLHGIVSHLVAI